MQRGVKADELFQGVGHVAKARAFASEELRDFWEREPLLSREAYERQWLQANYGGIIT